MKVALLGLAQSGKKTFFTLLTGRKSAAPIVLKEGESLEGIAPICDPRVVALAEMFKPERTKFAENTIVLCPDVAEGEGAPGKAGKRPWLEAARNCDLLCMVVRAFSTAEVYHPKGAVDAERDRSFLEAECLLADLELIESRLARMAKEKRAGQTAQQVREEHTLARIKDILEREMKWTAFNLEPHELEPIKSLNLLVLKPLLWAYNVDENALASAPADPGSNMFKVSCRIEQEIMALDSSEERLAYLKDLGVTAAGLDRLNQAAYDTMGLMSFYTVGKDEVRAWTIRKGTLAPAAAGKVHSDIERGFIRVEVIKYDDLMAAGGEAAAKAQGKAQVKGRDYIIEDGDVCHFRFNV